MSRLKGQVFEALTQGPMTARDVASLLECSTRTASRHLAAMHSAGEVDRIGDGRWRLTRTSTDRERRVRCAMQEQIDDLRRELQHLRGLLVPDSGVVRL